MSDEEEKDKDYIAGDGESPREEAGNDVMRRVPVPERGDVKYQLSGMYRNWFLEYASYVILERAVPHIADGLKPVQRRILHAMKLLDDGRYNKVANIIGSTMQFHPHGDASIGTAGYYERPDTAVCLETQFYPDTPSHSDFPSCLVLPEKAYEHCTLFHFQVQKEE